MQPKIIVYLILSCFCFVSHAQLFEIGKVMDSLSVTNSEKETYTLYLPTTYHAKKPLPILFIFSPAGKGKNGVKAFIQSAEAYNYILVSSNNARNGSLERNLNIAQRLFNHVFSTFLIEENRIYLAGFSGGARLATAIASVSNQIEGVIACGAGFISAPNYMPTKPNFSYAGLCGDGDMNYQEMLTVINYLNRLKISNTLFTFDGKHQWPPNEQLLRAFNWLEMEALKKGYIKKNKNEIMAHYLNDFNVALAIEKNNHPLVAAEDYNRILNTYGPFLKLDSIRQSLQTLKKNKVYTNTLKARKKAFEKENILNALFLNRLDKDLKNPKKTSLKWWEKEFKKLKKQGTKENSQITKMHERVRFNLFATAYFMSKRDNTNSNQEQRLFCNALIALLRST